jgi:phosphate starvation-inducible PhoH-like protein
MTSRKKNKNNQVLSMQQHLDNFRLNNVSFTEKQKKFFSLCNKKESKITFVSGPAGSSKTFISVYTALRLLSQDRDLDLIYVRTIIESAEKGLGALPGDLNEKFNPYMIPLIEKLNEILPESNTSKNDLIDSGRIEAMPINFLRGVSWKDKIVILDEAQNATFKELTTFITRIGENCKVFICGDLMQSDINGRSGFGDMIKIFNDSESQSQGINCFTFNESDIKRSEILKFIIGKLNKTKNEKR